MPEAIVVRKYGGPEVLQLEEVPSSKPGLDELLIRHTAIGVNFHDIYVRSGLYKSLSLPGTPGIEGIGKVIEVGKNVTEFKEGDRVAYITPHYNGYSSERTIPVEIAVPVPDDISDQTVASGMLKGLTVQMLTRLVTKIKLYDRVLIHAAAGGVGQLLVQAVKRMGAMVIGTVGSESKAKIALDAGCDHIIFYREEKVLDRVMDITDGERLHLVFDSVGKDTFYDSLDSLTYQGHLVNFGQSSGPIEGFEIPMLAKRSVTLSRPMLFHYLRDREQLLNMSDILFDQFALDMLTMPPPLELPLGEAARAHELLESRKLAQAVILIP